MDTEGQELGPYEPVPDVLALAAIERAIRHGADDAWITTVGKHLGYQPTVTPPAAYASSSNGCGSNMAGPLARNGTAASTGA